MANTKKHADMPGAGAHPEPLPGKLDLLFILPPLFAFMKRASSVFLLGPGYLVSYLKKKGITARIYNSDIYGSNYREKSFFNVALAKCIRAVSGFVYFARRWADYYGHVNDLNNPIWNNLRIVLRKAKPRIIGISASMITIPSTAVVARIVREELPQAKIIVGGPGAVTCSEELIHNEAIDFLVLGEGEDTLTELVSFILGRENCPEHLEEIRGIMYRNTSGIVTTPKRPLIADLDAVPFPDRDSMFVLGDDGEFQTIHLNADILASRGCPYPCKFCSAFAAWGTHKTRFRGADNILDELIHLNSVYGQRYFVFWDDLFVIDRERTIELCEKIISSGLEIEWVCLVRLNTIDAELLAIMKRAGCREIQIGIESGNNRILKHIGKDLTVAEIRDKVPIVRASGIEWGIFLIIGFPSETRVEMEDTLRLIDEIKPTWVAISIFTPYPGTVFFKELEEQGRLGGNFMRGDFWYPNNNYTGTMQDSEFRRFAIWALNYGDHYNLRRVFRLAYIWKKLSAPPAKKKADKREIGQFESTEGGLLG